MKNKKSNFCIIVSYSQVRNLIFEDAILSMAHIIFWTNSFVVDLCDLRSSQGEREESVAAASDEIASSLQEQFSHVKIG